MEQNEFYTPRVDDDAMNNQEETKPETSDESTTDESAEETQRINVLIPKDIVKVAKQAAFFLEKNFGEYVSEALDEKNKQSKEKAREALL